MWAGGRGRGELKGQLGGGGGECVCQFKLD